jgi:hypothetical protein
MYYTAEIYDPVKGLGQICDAACEGPADTQDGRDKSRPYNSTY